MGLDMYLHRIRKPADRREFHQVTSSDWYDEYEDEKLIRIDGEDIKRDEHKDLLPYITKVTVRQKYIDVEKLSKEKAEGSPLHLAIQMYDESGVSFGFSYEKDGKRRSFEITHDEIKNGGFIKEEDIEFFICAMEEVAYWRENSKLQKRIYALFPDRNIENCGQYRLNKDQIGKIAKACPDTDGITWQESDQTGETGVFYCEWY